MTNGKSSLQGLPDEEDLSLRCLTCETWDGATCRFRRQDFPLRKTIMNQRKIMEQLQQQFKEALVVKPGEEDIKPLEVDGEAT